MGHKNASPTRCHQYLDFLHNLGEIPTGRWHSEYGTKGTFGNPNELGCRIMHPLDRLMLPRLPEAEIVAYYLLSGDEMWNLQESAK